MLKIKFHESQNDQFYFTIVGANGEKLATSETYTQKHNCLHTASLLKSGMALCEIVDVDGEVLEG